MIVNVPVDALFAPTAADPAVTFPVIDIVPVDELIAPIPDVPPPVTFPVIEIVPDEVLLQP